MASLWWVGASNECNWPFFARGGFTRRRSVEVAVRAAVRERAAVAPSRERGVASWKKRRELVVAGERGVASWKRRRAVVVAGAVVGSALRGPNPSVGRRQTTRAARAPGQLSAKET